MAKIYKKTKTKTNKEYEIKSNLWSTISQTNKQRNITLKEHYERKTVDDRIHKASATKGGYFFIFTNKRLIFGLLFSLNKHLH